MPKITFLPSGKTRDVPSGTLLMDAAHMAGIMIDLPCGGKGTCGKCLVRLDHGQVAEKPGIALTDGERESGFIIACQSSITADVTISIPDQSAHATPTDIDDSIDPICEPFPAQFHLSPLTTQVSLCISRAGREDGLSDIDRVDCSLKSLFQDQDITYPLSVIQKLADTLREQDGLGDTDNNHG
jgi:uncharacterized 2Fe-2S/4Fe-4S cluster protein (DUF4445 family)